MMSCEKAATLGYMPYALTDYCFKGSGKSLFDKDYLALKRMWSMRNETTVKLYKFNLRDMKE